MRKKDEAKDCDGIKELMKFYHQKRNEQKALQKLLEQLEKKQKLKN